MKTNWRPGNKREIIFFWAGLCAATRAGSGHGKESGHPRAANWPSRVGAGAGLTGDPSRREPVSALPRTVPGLELAQPGRPNQGHGRACAVAQAGAESI